MGRAEEAFLLERLIKLREKIDHQLARLGEMKSNPRIRRSTVTMVDDKIRALRGSRDEVDRLVFRLEARQRR